MINRFSRRNVFGALLAALFAPLVARFRSASAAMQDEAVLPPSDSVDRECNVTTYVYDEKGHLLSVIEPIQGEVASFTYDECSI